MFKKSLHKSDVAKEEVIVAPMTGVVKKLVDVPDPIFSEKMLGDGIAIEPDEGVVVAPIDGEITEIFPTKHAIGMRGASGLELLIHIGLETVALNGDGFETFVKQGDQVEAGTRLVEVDLDTVLKKSNSIITPVIMTNGDIVQSVDDRHATKAIAGKTELLHVHLK